MAHNAGGALQHGIDADRLEAVWSYRESPLFSDAERVALEFAMAASAQPNEVDDALFERMRQAWTDDQIVEIVSVVSLFGFFNRFNDTMATPLEDVPARTAETHLAGHGWHAGKHAG